MTYETVDARVWATNIFVDPELIYAFGSDNLIEEEDRAYDAMKRVVKGDPLPADRFPKEMYVANQYEKYDTLPQIFKAGGFWVVSKCFAEVLRRFELGQTSLYPVIFYKHNRTILFDGEYFCLAFGETKDTFVPGESPRAKQITGMEVWIPKAYGNDNGLGSV